MSNAPTYAEADSSADRSSIYTVGRFDSRQNSFECVLALAQRYADPSLAVHPAFRVTQSEMDLKLGTYAIAIPPYVHVAVTGNREEACAPTRCADQVKDIESKSL